MLHGSFNGGIPAPSTQGREPRVTPCCAKCRRGIKGYGELPCGYDGKCPNNCHTKEQR